MDGKGVLFTNLAAVIANIGKFVELLGRGPIIGRLHLAHINKLKACAFPTRSSSTL